MRKPSFQTALTALAALALLAGLTLDDPVRLATMILLAGLALKTYIGVLRERQAGDANEEDDLAPETEETGNEAGSEAGTIRKD